MSEFLIINHCSIINTTHSHVSKNLFLKFLRYISSFLLLNIHIWLMGIMDITNIEHFHHWKFCWTALRWRIGMTKISWQKYRQLFYQTLQQTQFCQNCLFSLQYATIYIKKQSYKRWFASKCNENNILAQ